MPIIIFMLLFLFAMNHVSVEKSLPDENGCEHVVVKRAFVFVVADTYACGDDEKVKVDIGRENWLTNKITVTRKVETH